MHPEDHYSSSHNTALLGKKIRDPRAAERKY
jgi:hypothetical protein